MRKLATACTLFPRSGSKASPFEAEVYLTGDTHRTTVLVETMYSTSLVHGFMKLNHRLRSVIKEPSLILNL